MQRCRSYRSFTTRTMRFRTEAIGAELNIFMAEKVVSKRRVGLVFEVRDRVLAEAAFSAGPLALGVHPVPQELLTALLSTVPDDNAYIGLEALYGFGALAVDAAGTARRELLRTAAPEFAAFVGASEPGQRVAALRVVGRVWARRIDDPPVDEVLGDAVVLALNDQDAQVRSAARAALGAMRYERAVQALTELLQHFRTGAVADELFDALARIGHATSRPLMLAALDRDAAAMKRSAIEGLARMGDSAALSAIERSAGRDRNESVLLARAFAPRAWARAASTRSSARCRVRVSAIRRSAISSSSRQAAPHCSAGMRRTPIPRSAPPSSMRSDFPPIRRRFRSSSR